MRQSTALRAGLLAVFGVIVIETLALLFLNSGRLIFTLDDAYIHLALAENLLKGHYGVNLGEFSSASSSILWPFLLTPFSGLAFASYAVLLINVVAGLLTVWVLWQILSASGAGVSEDGVPPATLLLWLAFLVLACNVIGLIFTGMEHSLQVLLTSAILLGLIRETQTRRVSWWAVAALVTAPLIRFETMFLAGPALVYLFLRSHRASAILCGTLIGISLGAFALFLARNHSGILPTSVMAKSGFREFDGIVPLVASILRFNLESPQGVALASGLTILAMCVLSRWRDAGDRLLAAVAAAGVVTHLCMGRTGGFGRYESYIWGFTLLTIVHLYKRQLKDLTLAAGHWRSAVAMTIALAAVCLPYTAIAVLTPLASNNIYEQQYQMHRFATEFVKDVVGVNDLGYVSYRNNNYVLDFYGLASREALISRWKPREKDWMQEMAGRYGAKLAMIYDDWFFLIPKGWMRIGELRLGKPRIAPSRSTVGIYVINATDEARYRRLLAEFAGTVPRGVVVQLASEEAAAQL